MIVRVTQRNIEEGVARDATKCPIACAFRDAGFTHVNVGQTKVSYVASDKRNWAGSGKSAYEYGLPSWAVDFVDQFDAGISVKPIEMDVE